MWEDRVWPSRVILSALAALLLATNLGAQTIAAAWINGFLPPEAKIIETADLNTGTRTDRALVLWMLHPKRVTREENGGGCSDWVYGDYWYGPTRLSLFDLSNRRLINTIEVRSLYELPQEDDHPFPVPFRVPNGLYYVPAMNENKEGSPRIMRLQDLTGEGVFGQFVLFEYEACGISLTSVLGYSPKSDRTTQYGVETLAPSGRREVVPWVEQVFGQKAIRPGHWDFNWEPGHGADVVIHERVSFDPAKQVFVETQSSKPYPQPANLK